MSNELFNYVPVIIGVALVLLIVGFYVARGHVSRKPAVVEPKVIRDWSTTGAITFVTPRTGTPEDANTPEVFYLQVEESRVIESFMGGEFTEVRWRNATLNEAKHVVTAIRNLKAGDPMSLPRMK